MRNTFRLPIRTQRLSTPSQTSVLSNLQPLESHEDALLSAMAASLGLKGQLVKRLSYHNAFPTGYCISVSCRLLSDFSFFFFLLLLLSYGHFPPRFTYLVALCGIDPLSPYLHYEYRPLSHSGAFMGTSDELGLWCSRFWLGTLRIYCDTRNPVT